MLCWTGRNTIGLTFNGFVAPLKVAEDQVLYLSLLVLLLFCDDSQFISKDMVVLMLQYIIQGLQTY